MTTAANDFDAAKAIVEQLKGMPKEQQQRVLRWVSEHLGIVGITAMTEQLATELNPAHGAVTQTQGNRVFPASVRD
jgi:hypothetical protein